jgi:hypothetical protein
MVSQRPAKRPMVVSVCPGQLHNNVHSFRDPRQSCAHPAYEPVPRISRQYNFNEDSRGTSCNPIAYYFRSSPAQGAVLHRAQPMHKPTKTPKRKRAVAAFAPNNEQITMHNQNKPTPIWPPSRTSRRKVSRKIKKSSSTQHLTQSLCRFGPPTACLMQERCRNAHGSQPNRNMSSCRRRKRLVN